MDTKKLGINSKMVHAGHIDDPFGSATVPIYQTSTFSFRSAEHGAHCFSGESDGFIYTRIGNPTIQALENNLAALENGHGGIATASGMAAINTVYMTYLGAGEHLVSHNALYGPARGVMETIYPRYGVECTYIDATNIDNIRRSIRPNTRMIYLETPANPTMGITDIAEAAKIAHAHGIPLVVDNTFCSPYLQRPLDLGADVVIHSLTKFINGHADIVGGVVIAKEETEYRKIRNHMVNLGFNMDPHQAFLVLRGVKTLGIRIEKAQQSAVEVARYLEKHPKVEWIMYPGLPSHPQYELAKRQMDGPGTMISFGLKGGYEAGKVLMDNVHLALLAVSLGGVETLIQHPASMTHSRLPKEKREEAGITDGLVRYSVGIEDLKDIIEDLEHALSKV